MKRMLFGLFIIMTLTASQAAFAAGFGLYEGSARGNGLGGLTGQADDPSALFYNPAGITQLEGIHFMAGATIIDPYADLTLGNIYSDETTEGQFVSNYFTPPHIYYTQQISPSVWFGLSVYSRYGLGSEFEPEWDGRYSNINTTIETVNYNANVAWKITDSFSFSFGVSVQYLDAVLEQAIDANQFMLNPHNDPRTTEFDAIQTIEGDNLALSWNASVFYKPTDKWSLGAHFVSRTKHKLEGVAHFDRPDAQVPATWFIDANVTADTIELPDFLFLGFAYRHSDKISVGGGLVRTGWSSLQELVFHYDPAFLIIPQIGEVDEASKDLRWEDVWRYNLGVEYQYNQKLTLLGGYTFDESPIPDDTISFLLPTNDRDVFNMGFGWQMDKWLFEGAFNYLVLRDRDIEERQLADGVLEASVDAGALLYSFSFSRKFR